MDYFPYGGIRLDQQSGAFNEQRKYTGHEYDVDSGLTFANARYYNASIGRFVSQDPLFVNLGGDLTKYNKKLPEILIDPQKLNSYSYVENNPVNRTDPTGEASTWAYILYPQLTASQVTFWRFGAYALKQGWVKNTSMPIAGQLLDRSVSLNPSGIVATEDNGYKNITNSVKSSERYNSYINGKISEAEAAGHTSISQTYYDDNSINWNGTGGDLNYALGGTKNISINGNRGADGQWSLDVQIHDIYDFAPKDYGDLFGNVANNTAYASQKTGAISKYNIDIKFKDQRKKK